MKIVRRVHVHTFQICFKENICIVQPGEKPVAKDSLNNSHLTTRPNQSWAILVETNPLINTPRLLPKSYFHWFFSNSNTQVSLNDKPKIALMKSTGSAVICPSGIYRFFHNKLEKNKEMLFYLFGGMLNFLCILWQIEESNSSVDRDRVGRLVKKYVQRIKGVDIAIPP